MKQRKLSFKYKKEKTEITVVQFETLNEAIDWFANDSGELLKIINYGAEQLAKMNHMGINPLRPKRTKFKLDASKVDETTMELLRSKGAIR